MMQVDEETRGVLKFKLRSINLENLEPNVEMCIGGQASGVDIIRMLSVAYQQGWHDGEACSAEKVRNTLTKLVGRDYLNGNGKRTNP